MISEKRDDRPLRSGRVSNPDRVDAEILSRCRHCVPHAHDCLTARVELARQCRAKQLGLSEAEGLIQETLIEEENTDELLSDLAEDAINPAAVA